MLAAEDEVVDGFGMSMADSRFAQDDRKKGKASGEIQGWMILKMWAVAAGERAM